MPVPVSVVSFRGSYLAEISDLLLRLNYRHAQAPHSCSTAREAERALNRPTGDRNIVTKLAYEAGGWTHLFDPETVVLVEDEELSRFASDKATKVFAWVCDRFSGTYAFKVFDPELRRDLFVVGGSVVTDVGVPLPEEKGIDWSRADESAILKMVERLSTPYDELSKDRTYCIYTLDESHMPEPDLSAVNVEEQSLPPEETVARVVGHVAVNKKPWWKLW